MTLLEAIKSGDADRAAELVSADPSLASSRTPEGASYVSFAMYYRQPKIAEILSAVRSDLDLYEACTVGALDRTRELIDADPGLVNSFAPDGFAPVALASYFGHAEIVQALIAAGADVNARAQNVMQVAALHAAVSTGNARIVEMLLTNGADPNLEQQQGITPMQAAVANNDHAVMELLKAHGAK